MKASNNLDRFLLFSSILLFLSYVYSFSYDLGLLGFFGFGISFNGLPFDISNYIKNTFDWLPYFTIGILFIIFQEFYLKHVEKWKTEGEIINESYNPKRTKRIRELPFIILGWVSLIGFIINYFFCLFSGDRIHIELSFTCFIFVYIYWIHNKLILDNFKKIETYFSKNIANIISNISLFVVLPSIFLCSLGVGHCNKIISKEYKNIVYFKNQKSLKTTIVRTFDKHLLIYDKKENQLKVINMDKVSSYSILLEDDNLKENDKKNNKN